MRVKFLGKDEIAEGMKYLEDNDYEVALVMNALVQEDKSNDIRLFQEVNSYSLIGRIAQSDFSKASTKFEIQQVSGQSVKIACKTVERIKVSNLDGGGIKDRSIVYLELATRKQLVEELKKIPDHKKEASFLYLSIERKVVDLTATGSDLEKLFLGLAKKADNTFDDDNKTEIIKIFLKNGERYLNNLLSSGYKLKENTDQIYKDLGEQNYIQAVKNKFKGHLPLIGPNKYIYIDFQDWVRVANDTHRGEDFDAIFKEFYAKDMNKDEEIANNFPLQPSNFLGNIKKKINLSWNDVIDLFKNTDRDDGTGKLKEAYYSNKYKSYYKERLSTPRKIIPPAPPVGKNIYFEKGMKLEALGTAGKSDPTKKNQYLAGIKSRAYTDLYSNTITTSFPNLKNDAKKQYEKVIEELKIQQNYKEKIEVTSNSVFEKLIDEHKNYYFANKKSYIETQKYQKDKFKSNSWKKKKKNFFHINIKSLLENSMNPGKYWQNGVYLPFHYHDLYNYVVRDRDWTNNAVENLKFEEIIEGMTPHSKIRAIHNNIKDSHKSTYVDLNNIFGNGQIKDSGYAEYLWFLVMVNAESSRHLLWNLIARIDLEAAKDNYISFTQLFDKESPDNVSYIPKTPNAVRTMKDYLKIFYQKILSTTVAFQSSIEKKENLQDKLNSQISLKMVEDSLPYLKIMLQRLKRKNYKLKERLDVVISELEKAKKALLIKYPMPKNPGKKRSGLPTGLEEIEDIFKNKYTALTKLKTDYHQIDNSYRNVLEKFEILLSKPANQTKNLSTAEKLNELDLNTILGLKWTLGTKKIGLNDPLYKLRAKIEELNKSIQLYNAPLPSTANPIRHKHKVDWNCLKCILCLNELYLNEVQKFILEEVKKVNAEITAKNKKIKHTKSVNTYINRWSKNLIVYLIYHYYKGCYDCEKLEKNKVYEAKTKNTIPNTTQILAVKDNILQWANSKHGLYSLLKHIPIEPS